MNPLLGFLRVVVQQDYFYVRNLIIIALLSSLWMIISSFGHASWTVLLVWLAVTLWTVTSLWATNMFRSVTALWVVCVGLLVISLMGVSDSFESRTLPPDAMERFIAWMTGTTAKPKQLPPEFVPGFMRYISALIGIILAEGSFVILAILAWGNVLFGLTTFATFSTAVDVAHAPPEAKRAFRVGAIIAFWLGFAGFAASIATPHIPWRVALVVWMLIIVIIAGALALPSEVPFKVTFYLTLAALLVMLGLVVGFVLEGTGVLEKPLFHIVKDLWNTVPDFPNWLKWLVGLGSFYIAMVLIAESAQKPWISLSAGAIVFFFILGLGIVWLTSDGYVFLYTTINAGNEFTVGQKFLWIVAGIIGGLLFLRNLLYRRLVWIAGSPLIVLGITLFLHQIVWYGASLASYGKIGHLWIFGS